MLESLKYFSEIWSISLIWCGKKKNQIPKLTTLEVSTCNTYNAKHRNTNLPNKTTKR